MKKKIKPVVMTVAGFDPGSGAGISADLKTFSSLGIYGTGLITCLTSQSHTGFGNVSEIDPGILRNQLKALEEGYDIKCVKTGLLTLESAQLIGEWKKENPRICLICDPVFSATSGSEFFSEKDAAALMEGLYRYADLITPNIHEASILAGIKISIVEDMVKAGREIKKKLPGAVLIKGGHLEGDAVDILFSKEREEYFTHIRIPGVNTHGSGCILSAAITAYIASGEELGISVSKAKDYLTGLMKYPVSLEGLGPLIDPGEPAGRDK